MYIYLSYRHTELSLISSVYIISIPAGAVAYTYSSSRFGRGVDASLTNFLCYGNESHLLNCTYNVANSCGRDYTAGVLCYGNVVSGILSLC